MSILPKCFQSPIGKVGVVINVAIIYLAGHIIVQTYYYSIDKAKVSVEQKLKAIAKTASLQINTEEHLYLTSRFRNIDGVNQQNKAYAGLHNTLLNIQLQNNLSSAVYTMVYDSTTQNFQFIATSSSTPYFRHPYKMFPEKLLSHFNEGGSLGIHESENGKWVSAFSPIKDSNGNTIALLQVDENFDHFIMNAEKGLYRNLFLSLLILVPFISLFIWYVRMNFKQEEQIKQQLREQNEEIQTQNEEIVKVNSKLEKAYQVIEKKNEELDIKVKDRTKELLKANKDLGTFLYRSSHDIQGPLKSLEGLSNLMKTGHGNLSEFSVMIEKSVQTLLMRVKSINRIYEIKTKELVPAKLYASDIHNHINHLYGCTFTKHNINFNANIDNDFSFETADKELLLYIFEELVDNSIQYRAEVNPQIALKLTHSGHSLNFEITDNGQGIPMKYRKKIFLMFERMNESSQGSGLGLYCSKLSISRLGGKIQLNNSENERTTFKVSLPYKSASRKEGNFSRYDKSELLSKVA